jgi:glucose-6-phosphate 1-dehydrogenase
MRDMLQNHLAQVITLVAMEPPSSFDADSIRYEKIKVLRSIGKIKPEDVVLGQYTAGNCGGEHMVGYLESEGIEQSSRTETFVALRLAVNTWRWQGVPFYIRTGKAMPARTLQIALRFREAPISLFETMGAGENDMETADVLIITLQPDEGFSFHFDVKTPGLPFGTKRIPLTFKYSSVFEEMPAAYRTLILDVLHGDQTLFVHADEVEESWRIFDPIIGGDLPVCGYPAGTWGPEEAAHLAIPEVDLWQIE